MGAWKPSVLQSSWGWSWELRGKRGLSSVDSIITAPIRTGDPSVIQEPTAEPPEVLGEFLKGTSVRDVSGILTKSAQESAVRP
jgi:hypothetical protein